MKKSLSIFLLFTIGLFSSCISTIESDFDNDLRSMMHKHVYVVKAVEVLSLVDDENGNIYTKETWSFYDTKDYGEYGIYMFAPNGTFTEGNDGTWTANENTIIVRFYDGEERTYYCEKYNETEWIMYDSYNKYLLSPLN
jgi:hypothetical protein